MPQGVEAGHGLLPEIAAFGEGDRAGIAAEFLNQSRFDMYLTLSEDGRTFDQTWLLLHNTRGNTDGGMHKGGGPQYFQAVTVGGNIWVVYSIAKEQVGISRIPLAALPAPRTLTKRAGGEAVRHMWAGGRPDHRPAGESFGAIENLHLFTNVVAVEMGGEPLAEAPIGENLDSVGSQDYRQGNHPAPHVGKKSLTAAAECKLRHRGCAEIVDKVGGIGTRHDQPRIERSFAPDRGGFDGALTRGDFRLAAGSLIWHR